MPAETEQSLEIEANVLEEARQQVRGRIPAGYHFLSETVLCDGEPVRRNTKTLEVDAYSLEEARAQVKAQLGKGLQVFSETVVAEKRPGALTAAADSAEEALAKAKMAMPADSRLLRSAISTPPARHLVSLEAPDEGAAGSLAAALAKERHGAQAVVKGVRMTKAGAKGFLGVGAKPNQYEAEVLIPALVEVTYQPRMRFRFTAGEVHTPPARIAVKVTTAPVAAPDGEMGLPGLAEVVAAVEAGSTIHLLAGIHKLASPLLIDTPVTLAGAGAGTTRVECDAKGCVVRMEGHGTHVVRDLAFRHTGLAPGGVVEVAVDEIRMQRCVFSGAVMPRDDEPMVPGTGFWGAGLLLDAQTAGVVEQCTFTQNALSGVQVEAHACPTLRGNVSEKNGLFGIVVGNDAAPTVEENRVRGNKYGLDYAGQPETGVVRKNTVTENGVGIQISAKGRPLVQENQCDRNDVGILYRDSASGTAQKNQCGGNRFGIMAGGRSHATLLDNTCAGNAQAGIVFGEWAEGRADKNSCTGNGVGLICSEEAMPSLSENVCSRNQLGMIWQASAAGVAERNECKENSEGGVLVKDNAHPVLRQNRCNQNGRHGIQVTDEAEPTLDGNSCMGNKGGGIVYTLRAGGTATNNLCTVNQIGFYVEATARVRGSNNNCGMNLQADTYDGRR